MIFAAGILKLQQEMRIVEHPVIYVFLPKASGVSGSSGGGIELISGSKE